MNKLKIIGFIGLMCYLSISCSLAEQKPNKILKITPEYIFNAYITKNEEKELAIAASKGDINTVEILSANKFNVNATGRGGMTPLYCAIIASNKEGVLALLRSGANPNHIDDAGYSPVHIATLYVDDTYFLEKLLEYGGDPNLLGEKKENYDPFSGYSYEIDADGNSPMHLAAQKNSFLSGGSGLSDSALKKMEVLLKYGGDINLNSKWGTTPLMDALSTKNYDRAYFLLEKNSNCKSITDNGKTVSDFYNFHREIEPPIDSEQFKFRSKVVEYLKKNCHDEWVKLK